MTTSSMFHCCWCHTAISWSFKVVSSLEFVVAYKDENVNELDCDEEDVAKKRLEDPIMTKID